MSSYPCQTIMTICILSQKRVFDETHIGSVKTLNCVMDVNELALQSITSGNVPCQIQRNDGRRMYLIRLRLD